MTENDRLTATTEMLSRGQASRRGRARSGLAALMAVAMLSVATLVTASAQGGSGGVGTGGGGGGGSTGSGGDRYAQMYKELSRSDKRWAKSTSYCESTNDPNIHGGGGSFHGAFQFMLQTWKTSPKSPGGDPHKYPWKTQAVVAVALKHRDGAGHWPNCG